MLYDKAGKDFLRILARLEGLPAEDRAKAMERPRHPAAGPSGRRGAREPGSRTRSR